MTETDTPEVYVVNRMPPRVREKVVRLLEEKDQLNGWFAQHFSGVGPACPRHPVGSLPRGGSNGGAWDEYLVADGLEPEARGDDERYLRTWYHGPISEERTRRVRDAEAVLETDRVRRHAEAHAADPAGITAHPNGGLHPPSMKEQGGPLHSHDPTYRDGCNGGSGGPCDHNTRTYTPTEARTERRAAKLDAAGSS